MAGGVHQNHPVVFNAIGGLRDNPCGRAGARHQGKRPDPLSIIDADNRLGREVVRPEPERPDDFAHRVSLDYPVIELVCDQDVAGFVETRPMAESFGLGCAGQQ